jgi:hypothetical protein
VAGGSETAESRAPASPNDDWEVVVVGAGAAGLMAAIVAAERGRRTLVVEKNRRPGVKILMSGGTRCNLTHDTDARGISAAFGPQGKFLHSSLAALDPRGVVEFFAAEGVATKVEPPGKVFPVSNHATDVLSALLRRLERSGATLATAESVASLERAADGDGFRVVTTRRVVAARRAIVACGGKSYPGAGTTGDGYAWLARLGHTIVPPRPALTPLTTDALWVRSLTGVTLSDVVVRIEHHENVDQKPLAQRRGGLLFTHFGLSGPAAMDVSHAVTDADAPAALDLVVDLLPDVAEDELDRRMLAVCAARGGKTAAALVPEEVPRRLATALVAAAGVEPSRRAAEVSKGGRTKLVAAIKKARIPLSGTRGFAKAEVTAGGVSLKEVDSRTMESKLVPGLFLAGEILDLDGPIGGYNFQAAFSTGWLAGTCV